MHLLAALQRRQEPDSSPGGPPNNSTASPTQSPTLGVNPTASATITDQSSIPTPPAQPHKPGSNSTVIAAVVATIAAVLGLLLLWFVLRRTRRKHKNPKYVPTSFLKKIWEKWDPEPMHYRLPDSHDHLEPHRATDLSSRSSDQPPVSFEAAAEAATAPTNNANRNSTATVGVDRNTSVRSVMTLPAYHPSARDSEQVLGREGERAGIDVVIEFPEGADEEEAQREAEMEALYQVRLARRRENEEREERRRLRREARERGDYVALREIQARARAGSAASGQRTVEELRAEHDRLKKERQRAVSSVSYADLGVARHDGTRLRANSNDSEREGLLGDAASIAASSRYHRRDRSASSVISIDTMGSELPSPGLTRSRGNSRASRPESPLRSAHSIHDGQAGSSPEMIEHEETLHSPPGYENISLDTPQEERRTEPPPDYSSPVAARGEHRMSAAFSVASPTMDMAGRMGSATEITSARPTLVEVGGRRTSGTSPSTTSPSATHVGQLISSSRRTSGSSGTSTPRSARGVGGVPQLPSLRLTTLPSIHVDGPSPTVRSINEEEHHPTEHV